MGGGRMQDRGLQGIVIILASVFLMAAADGLIKFISGDVTIWQLFLIRSLIAAPAILILLRFLKTPLVLKAPWWVWARTALLVNTWLLYYAAFPVLSLAVAAVAAYTNPIFTTILSAVFLGDKISKRQIGGIALGFVGVLVILRPGTDDFSWYVLLPMLAATNYSSAMVLTRGKCQDEDPMVLGFAQHIGFLITGAVAIAVLAIIGLDGETKAAYPFLFGDWGEMGAQEWGLLALLGVLATGYFAGVARAYQIGPPATIATFDYAYLVFAALWGIILFADTPDAYTIAGMILITSAGLLVAGRK